MRENFNHSKLSPFGHYAITDTKVPNMFRARKALLCAEILPTGNQYSLILKAEQKSKDDEKCCADLQDKNFLATRKKLNFKNSFRARLRVVPYFSSGIVERAKRERARKASGGFLAWVEFHARSRFARSTIPEENKGVLVCLLSGTESFRKFWETHARFYYHGKPKDMFVSN